MERPSGTIVFEAWNVCLAQPFDVEQLERVQKK
jgi:hypothetical protein